MKSNKIYDYFNIQNMLANMTANMDADTQLDFHVLTNSPYLKNRKKISEYDQFINILNIFLTFLLYYTDTCHQSYNETTYINEVYAPLYTITPDDSEYKKIPKYLHGIIDKKSGQFRHPNTCARIIKPARKKSKQFAQQIDIITQTIKSVQQNDSLFNKKNSSTTNKRIAALESIYNEILKLISICTICTMQNNTSPEHTSGSLDMLVEYKLATNFNMVATACEKRKKIQENLSNEITHTNNRIEILDQTYNTEHQNLLNTQNAQLASTKTFAEFQQLNQKYFNQRVKHTNKYIETLKTIHETQKQLEQKAKQAHDFERIQAQIQIAKITRMR
jgi:hypothetical protein